MDHAAVMDACEEKGRRHGIGALNEVERVVWLVSWVSFEADLGGLGSYYESSAGDHAVETVAALEAVGARRAASAVRAANSLFPGGVPGRTEEERQAACQAMRDGEDDPFDALDREFHAEESDLFNQLCDYMDAHADELSDMA
jgi:hypothetical protein